ncbi:hypothetical protein THAOC_12557 [Thalassiosira oceanica]|uniref:Uncharacterized protein n=1 Tax=Thalassiosira oceanica TaxID=159749 RepID=K0T7S8_THAOC|nr:hypothetical protein THAOC_12557 [Thalassiosira oceanica]|eukprot:EJK66522.1 hypothetical protein THAOC_12557 [Thalassiosira oceanica]
MEIAEECILEQNRPPFPILTSVKAVDPAMTDDFGLEVERRSTPRNYTSRRTPPITRSHITGFGNRQFSNGDPRPAESQVNRKCVEYDVGALNDDQSPNIHRSMAVASHGPIRLLLASFCSFADRSLFNPCYPKHYYSKAYHDTSSSLGATSAEFGWTCAWHCASDILLWPRPVGEEAPAKHAFLALRLIRNCLAPGWTGWDRELAAGRRSNGRIGGAAGRHQRNALRHHELHCTQGLHGLPPRQVLRRGMPEGPPQAAQESVQAARGRAQGRAAVQPGAREAGEAHLPDLCSANSVTNRGSFRTPCPDNDADSLTMIRARVAKKDPDAINHLGEQYCHGQLGLQKDMRKAVELWTEAAELGSVEALYHLGIEYESRIGAKEDKARSIQVYEKAAMLGCPLSRHELGCVEGSDRGNYDSAAKHFLIAAKMGLKESVENIKSLFVAGVVTKEQYAKALKGYQDAVEEMKSHGRDEASVLMKS